MSKEERGFQAQHLLDNALLKEVLSELDAQYHRAWRNAKTVEAREDLHRYVKVTEQLIIDLKQIAVTGQLAEARKRELEGEKRKLWQIV